MKKRTHIHTDFIKFIIEKYSEPKSVDDEEEDDNKKKSEVSDDEEEPEEEGDTIDDDDEIIEKLITEYKKVKKQYENNRIPTKRK